MSEDLYVRRLLAAYRELPDASGRVRPADRALAVQLFHQHVPLETVLAAFRLALARRRARPPGQPPLNAIRSLHYFLPLIDEATGLDPGYLDYLTQRAHEVSGPERAGRQPRK